MRYFLKRVCQTVDENLCSGEKMNARNGGRQSVGRAEAVCLGSQMVFRKMDLRERPTGNSS